MPKDLARKAYINTPHGQVNVRLDGPDNGAPLLMVHWTPLSGRMYAAHLPLLAARGFRAIAVDMLGYGRSDPRPADWSIEAWADNLAAVLDGLGIETAALIGGHTGASVAAELALRHPHRITRLVLDSCALPTPELRAAFAKMSAQARPAPDPEGTHERLAYRAAESLLRHYTPGFSLENGGIEKVWPAMIDYLETDFVSSGPISGVHDLSVRLPLITVPTLILGAETDTLSASFGPACALLPSARTHWFAGDHPIHDAARAEDYIAAWADFALGN